MGHKVNPNGYRFGINKNWESRWVADSDAQTAKWIVEDERVRKYFFANYKTAQIVRVEIERTMKTIDCFVYAGQPGGIIGKEGANIAVMTKEINKIVGRKIKVNINVITYENVAWSARVIAREIADAIENRVSFRNAQKMGMKKVMQAHALGVRTHVSGRLGGAEMAREEGYTEGVIPLTTLRADLDYALEEAHTTYGKIGVKVWINRGEIFGKGLNGQIAPKKPEFKLRGNFGDRNRGDRGPRRDTRSPTPKKEDAPATISIETPKTVTKKVGE